MNVFNICSVCDKPAIQKCHICNIRFCGNKCFKSVNHQNVCKKALEIEKLLLQFTNDALVSHTHKEDDDHSDHSDYNVSAKRKIIDEVEEDEEQGDENE